ncbi:hypothetical protein K488DRAFT_82662 [Vararia minispora EC-137]|uniref:Uncharacterized protein n=1 Tax=Vararia minispora EC-137 TaxID=1314806 RepID=A0ACB8QVH2_9AGAM|nr:hypothetical protein K488DRAFT_82662 [Vararia minispora EC-137]
MSYPYSVGGWNAQEEKRYQPFMPLGDDAGSGAQVPYHVQQQETAFTGARTTGYETPIYAAPAITRAVFTNASTRSQAAWPTQHPSTATLTMNDGFIPEVRDNPSGLSLQGPHTVADYNQIDARNHHVYAPTPVSLSLGIPFVPATNAPVRQPGLSAHASYPTSPDYARAPALTRATSCVSSSSMPATPFDRPSAYSPAANSGPPYLVDNLLSLLPSDPTWSMTFPSFSFDAAVQQQIDRGRQVHPMIQCHSPLDLRPPSFPFGNDRETEPANAFEGGTALASPHHVEPNYSDAAGMLTTAAVIGNFQQMGARQTADHPIPDGKSSQPHAEPSGRNRTRRIEDDPSVSPAISALLDELGVEGRAQRKLLACTQVFPIPIEEVPRARLGYSTRGTRIVFAGKYESLPLHVQDAIEGCDEGGFVVEEKYLCPLCQRKFGGLRDRNTHINVEHLDIPTFCYCRDEKCTKVYRGTKALFHHLNALQKGRGVV